jgi:hypothetical protein
MRSGGERGIRTPDTREGMPAFEAGAINHSAISPRRDFHFHFTKEARFHRLPWLDVTELSLIQLPFRVEASDWLPRSPYGAPQHREFGCRC